MNLQIGDKKIGQDQPAFIIAEAGVNHDGELKKALLLVDLAKKSGADCVKFQTYNPEKLLLVKAEKPAYQKKNVPSISQYQMLKKLWLSNHDHLKLANYCRAKKIIFMSTPYDEQSADFLEKLGVLAFKLASAEVVNHPFLEYIAKKGKPVILSVGLSDEKEIMAAVEIFKKNKALPKLALLHCHADYPTQDCDANLSRIVTLGKKTPVVIGYSDHSVGIIACQIAVALGAKIIEKHFTWNKKAYGPDHNASVEFAELKEMIAGIRKTELMLGSGKLLRTKSEEKNLLLRKSLVANRQIKKNTTLTKAMLARKRPGRGLWPTFTNYRKIIGKKAKKDIKADTLIKLEWLK